MLQIDAPPWIISGYTQLGLAGTLFEAAVSSTLIDDEFTFFTRIYIYFA